MRHSALLVLAALAPLTAAAQPAKLPPPPPPRPPHPSMPPATSPDELIGNWSVRLTTRVTTCKPMTSPAERSDETWTIDHVSQTLTIMTSSRLELTGPSSSGQRSYFQHTLNAKAKPHATILQFSHSIRDRFWGTLVRAEVIDKRSSDGTCVTVYDVSGTKVAP